MENDVDAHRRQQLYMGYVMNARHSTKLGVDILDFGPNTEKTPESIAEEETSRDLRKPVEQLLFDVHSEAMDQNRRIEENVIGVNKRLASLMARVAKSNQRATNAIIVLTVVLVIMTAVLIGLTILMLCKMQ